MKRPKRKGRPSTQPRPTALLIDNTFRWLKLDETARSFRAMRAFSLAAGTRIGEHARAERLRGSILYVRCDSSAWSQHLHMMKPQLVDRVRRTPGGEVVQEIRFNVGPLAEVAGWQAPEVQTPVAETTHELPPDVARALGDIDDEELREHLMRLFGKLGARER